MGTVTIFTCDSCGRVIPRSDQPEPNEDFASIEVCLEIDNNDEPFVDVRKRIHAILCLPCNEEKWPQIEALLQGKT